MEVEEEARGSVARQLGKGCNQREQRRFCEGGEGEEDEDEDEVAWQQGSRRSRPSPSKSHDRRAGVVPTWRVGSPLWRKAGYCTNCTNQPEP